MSIKRLYALIGLAIVAFIAYGVIHTAEAPVNAPTQETSVAPMVSVSVAIEGVLPAEVFEVREGATALRLLMDAAESHDITLGTKEYVGIGTLVEKIGSFENGTDGKYWVYYVNDAFAQVGASAYAVQPGDRIEWKFEAPHEE